MPTKRPAKRRPTKKRPSLPRVRTSERLSFKTCEQQWYWNFVDRLKPTADRPALRFGDLIHRSLEQYYKPGLKRGPHPAETFEKLYVEDLDKELARIKVKTPEEEWLEALDLGIAMLHGYVEMYKERDKEYKIIASEQTFEYVVRDSEGKAVCLYVGTFDGVWQRRSDKRLWFKEFKTTGSSVNQMMNGPLAMDEQAGSYWTFGPLWLREQGMLGPAQDLDGILYTFLRKSMPNPDWNFNALGQKLNQDGSVSKSQPGAYFGRQPVYREQASRDRMIQRVIIEARRMQAIRSGEATAIKNPGKLFMPNCTFCNYKDMCELHEAGQDWQSMAKMTMQNWNPYDAHEEKASDHK